MSYLKRHISRFHTWRLGSLLLADAVIFGMTNPNTAASSMLMVGFILLCATLYYCLDGVYMLAKLYGLPVRHKKRFVRTATLIGGGLIALQSIGQLSMRDMLVLVPLTSLMYFYVAYSRGGRQKTAPGQSVGS